MSKFLVPILRPGASIKIRGVKTKVVNVNLKIEGVTTKYFTVSSAVDGQLLWPMDYFDKNS